MRRSLLYISVLSAGLFGCAVGPDFHSPTTPNTNSYTESALPDNTVSTNGSGGAAQHFANGQDIPAQWWTIYHSPELNQLIELGLKNSPNLQAAQAALRQAEENLKAEIGSAFFPAVTAGFGGARGNYSNTGSSGGSTNLPGSNIFNLYNASVNVSYTFDIFGGNRREVEALRSQVDYQRYQLQAAYLTLTSNIVTTAVSEASIRAQIAATQKLIDVSQQQLNIVQKQLQLGGASLSDVMAQQTQLAQTQALLPPLIKSLAQTRDGLAVLVGSLPSNANLPTFELDKLTLPTDLPVSLPSVLVRQRPDIQASEALLHVASAQVGVATSNMLPQFTLTGSYGAQSTNFGKLFTGPSNIWNLQGQVLQTLFNGGALIAQRRAAVAAYDQAAAQYRQAVLQAFQNVADSLQALHYDAQAFVANKKAETAAQTTLAITQKQYKLGGVSYPNVLTAQQLYQQAYINRIKAQAARYSDTAALFQALGGGWWNRETK